MTQQQARFRGEKLLARLKEGFPGAKFKLEVWENLGWHCSVENNLFQVSNGYNGEGGLYSVLFKPHSERCGPICRHGDPVKAVHLAVKTLSEKTSGTIKFLTDVRDSLTKV